MSTTSNLNARLLAATAACPPIGADKKNTYSDYKYASLPKIRTVVVPALADEGLVVELLSALVGAMPIYPDNEGCGGRPGQLDLLFSLSHTDGSERNYQRTKPIPETSKTPIDKQVAGLVTSAWREFYADLLQLRLRTEDGDSDDHGQHHRNAKRASLPGRDGEGSAMDARTRREKEESDHDRRGSEGEWTKAAREVAEKKLFAEATALWLRLPEKLKLCEDGSERHQAAREDGCLQPFMDWARKQVAEAAAAPRETVDVGI